MNRRTILTLLGIGAAAMATTNSAHAESANAADIAAIRELIATYETTWNTSDLDGMGRLYHPEIHWVNVKGMHWRGFEEVDRAHRAFFDIMFRGTRQDLEEIESITQTAPGVAIAVVRWLHGAYKTPSGTQVPPQNTRMTLVLAKGEGGWKIVQGCNIEVDAQAARFDPIRGQKPG
jgi:uncharacterized protein (TIGR02246 family)